MVICLQGGNYGTQPEIQPGSCTVHGRLTTLLDEEFMYNINGREKREYAGIQSLFHLSNAVVMFTSNATAWVISKDSFILK